MYDPNVGAKKLMTPNGGLGYRSVTFLKENDLSRNVPFPISVLETRSCKKRISGVNITTQTRSFVILLTERRLQLNDGACRRCCSCIVGDKEKEPPDLIET